MFRQKAFLKRLHLEDSVADPDGKDNDIVEEVFRRTGASILGRRMFDEGEANWPEDAPFRMPDWWMSVKFTLHPLS